MARLSEAQLARYVIDEVLAAGERTGTPVRETPSGEVDALRAELGTTFGNGAPLEFRTMRDKASVQDGDAWRRLPELLSPTPHLLFWDHSHDGAGAELDGSRVVDVLAECFGFPFYVVDAARTYVVGMDDHDYLIGTGRAAGWIRTL